jgi:hypothetical protein
LVGRELETATATTKYHGINIEEGERKRRKEGREVEEMEVKCESWRSRH